LGGASLNRGPLNGTLPVSLSRWKPTIFGYSSLDSPPRVVLSGGNLLGSAPTVEKNLVFDRGNRVTILNPGSDQMQLTLNTANGLITGSFLHPADNLRHPIRGAVFLKQFKGAGYFGGITGPGRMELSNAVPR